MSELNKHAMYYAVFLSFFFVLNFFCTLASNAIAQIFQFLVITIEVVLIQRFAFDAKFRVLDGVMSYGTALSYIVKLFMYASMIVAFVKYIYFAFINPQFLFQQFQLAEPIYSQLLAGQNISDLKAIATNPTIIAMNSIWYNVILGLIVGLVLSFRLRTKPVN